MRSAVPRSRTSPLAERVGRRRARARGGARRSAWAAPPRSGTCARRARRRQSIRSAACARAPRSDSGSALQALVDHGDEQRRAPRRCGSTSMAPWPARSQREKNSRNTSWTNCPRSCTVRPGQSSGSSSRRSTCAAKILERALQVAIDAGHRVGARRHRPGRAAGSGRPLRCATPAARARRAPARRPRARSAVSASRRDAAVGATRRRRRLAVDGEAGALEILDQRRRPDDCLVVERECRDRDRTRRAGAAGRRRPPAPPRVDPPRRASPDRAAARADRRCRARRPPGHSPSTTPASVTWLKRPYGAASASTRCTAPGPTRGLKVCSSMRRRSRAATSANGRGASPKRANAPARPCSSATMAPRARSQRSRGGLCRAVARSVAWRNASSARRCSDGGARPARVQSGRQSIASTTSSAVRRRVSAGGSPCRHRRAGRLLAHQAAPPVVSRELGAPAIAKLLQTIAPAEEVGIAQLAIAGGEPSRGVEGLGGRTDAEVGRAQQREARRPRVVGGHAGQHEVERGRVRAPPRAAAHRRPARSCDARRAPAVRQRQIRQRPLIDERRRIAVRRVAGTGLRLLTQPEGEIGQLLLAIAAHEVEPVVGRRLEHRRGIAPPAPSTRTSTSGSASSSRAR